MNTSLDETKLRMKFPTLEEVQNMTNLKEIQKLHHIVIEESKSLDKEIQDMLNAKGDIEPQFELIDNLSSRINPISGSTLELSKSIQETSELAELISIKVRELDKIRERVKLAKTHVQDIVDLKECVDGVQTALLQQEFERAAHYIQRYLNIDPSLIEEDTKLILEQAERNLKATIQKKIDNAVQQGDGKEILRFCSLYIPLGKKSQGCSKYGDYLCNVIEKNIQNLHKSLSESREVIADEKINHTLVFAKMLGGIEILIKEQKPIIDSTFGPSGLLIVLQLIQELTRKHMVPLMKQFQADWKVYNYISQVKSMEKLSPRSLRRALDAKSNEFSDLTPLLEQMCTISQTLEAHRRFIVSLTRKCIGDVQKETEEKKKEIKLDQVEPQITQEVDDLVEAAGHDMLGNYIILEQHFMTQCISKIISPLATTQLTTENATNLINEVFYIFKESCNRARATYNADTICAFINLVDTCLNDKFRTFVNTQANIKSSGNLKQALIGINNLEVTCKYLPQLKQDIEIPCQKAFLKQAPIHFQKISVCLDALNTTQRRFRTLLQTNIELLFNAAMPKIQQHLDGLGDSMSYEITQSKWNENQINDPFMEQLIHNLDLIFTPHKEILSETNLDTFMHSIARFIVEYLEQLIFKKKFTKYGAKQLDKDLIALLTYFSSHTKRSMREKFERLQQISDLLNIDEVSDVKELKQEWETMGTCQLSNLEIQKIVPLRTELRNKADKKLQMTLTL